jgi:hypothetical protein
VRVLRSVMDATHEPGNRGKRRLVQNQRAGHRRSIMTLQDQGTVVTTEQPDPAGSSHPVTTESRETRSLSSSPSGSEFARRVIVLIFGLIEVVIGLRIVLLLLDARTGNDIVSGILNISQVFVAPFDGILRTNALHAGGSIFDVAAVTALVGWIILEAIVLWAVGIFRRERATA